MIFAFTAFYGNLENLEAENLGRVSILLFLDLLVNRSALHSVSVSERGFYVWLLGFSYLFLFWEGCSDVTTLLAGLSFTLNDDQHFLGNPVQPVEGIVIQHHIKLPFLRAFSRWTPRLFHHAGENKQSDESLTRSQEPQTSLPWSCVCLSIRDRKYKKVGIPNRLLSSVRTEF